MTGRLEQYTMRPARVDDVDAVCDLCNEWALRMRGFKTHDPVEERLEWQMPGFDLETDSRLVFTADGSLVAYASAWDTDEPHVRVGGFIRVHPDVDDADLEDSLFDWLEDRARQAIERAPEGARVVLNIGSFSEDEHRRELLLRRGYELVRHFVRLRIEMDEAPGEVKWPEGVEVRPFDRDQHLRAVALASREAFRDHWGHVEGSLEEELAQWNHWAYEDTDYDADTWHVAWDGSEVVGLSIGSAKRPEAENLAYIYVLAVRRAWRGRGIAKALLRYSFGYYYGRGKTTVDLHADAANLTGAMRMYESVGMRQIWRNDSYQKELRPGRDLAVKTLDEDKAEDSS
ncbi:MAG: GNAT family N-acetyltransferase [Candidatus Bipolaricaulota bacterium]|nr:MAG: GNAT family N-acetyltransferase [Candidatus Bipolaricaulota bacterium]